MSFCLNEDRQLVLHNRFAVFSFSSSHTFRVCFVIRYANNRFYTKADRNLFLNLSEQAYTASQASARISAHQFADKYMQSFGDRLKSNLPYAMLAKWPGQLLDMVREWETKKSKQSLQDLLFEQWLISNKSHFFDTVFQQAEIFDIAFDSSTLFNKRDDFLEHLRGKYAYENNMTSDMYAFPFVASMSVMLAGLACGTRDEVNPVSVNEIQKLVSSNGITVVQDADENVLTRTLQPSDINVRRKIIISWDVSEQVVWMIAIRSFRMHVQICYVV